MQGRIQVILDGGQAQVGMESTVVSGLCTPPRVLRPGGVTVEMLREVGGVWGGCLVGTEGLKKVNGEGKGVVNGVQPELGKSGLVSENGDEVPLVPGMKYRHYSPKAKVVLYEQNAPPPTMQKLLASLHSASSSSSSSSPSPLCSNTTSLPSIGIIRTRTWPKNWPAMGNGITNGTAKHDDDPSRIKIEQLSLGTSGAEISRGLFAALRELDERGVTVIHVEGIGEEDEGLAVMNRLRKAAGEVVR